MKSSDTPQAGMIVVPTRDRRITALEADTGRRIWSVTTQGANVAAPIPIPGTEDLLVASVDGVLYRLRQRNGREVWRSEAAGAAMVATPVIAGDPASDKAVVLVTSLDNRVTALSLATGARLWSVQRPHDAELTIAGQGGALVIGDRIFAGFSDGVLAAYALEDGATVWTADLAGDKRDFADIDATPMRVQNEAGEELVVAPVFRRGLFALTADGGDVAWHVRGEGFGHATVHDGLIAVGQASGRVWAIEAASGKVRWVSDVGTGWTGRPMMTSKYVIAPTGTDLIVLDRGSGRVVARWNDGRGVRSAPVFAWGRLYVLANSGLVHALDIY
jgi:outer membrane protein assembly factor BamB